jgi:hypothetical protein
LNGGGVPSNVVNQLGLELLGDGLAILADGRETVSRVYAASVLWDGHPREIEVDAVEAEVLLGMALMEGFDLALRVAQHGQVLLHPFTLKDRLIRSRKHAVSRAQKNSPHRCALLGQLTKRTARGKKKSPLPWALLGQLTKTPRSGEHL